jgi:hypothetical protein
MLLKREEYTADFDELSRIETRRARRKTEKRED